MADKKKTETHKEAVKPALKVDMPVAEKPKQPPVTDEEWFDSVHNKGCNA